MRIRVSFLFFLNLFFLLGLFFPSAVWGKCSGGNFDREKGTGVDCQIEEEEGGEAATFLYQTTRDQLGLNTFLVVVEFQYEKESFERPIYYRCGLHRTWNNSSKPMAKFIQWIYPTRNFSVQTLAAEDRMTAEDVQSIGREDFSYQIQCERPFHRPGKALEFSVVGRN